MLTQAVNKAYMYWGVLAAVLTMEFLVIGHLASQQDLTGKISPTGPFDENPVDGCTTEKEIKRVEDVENLRLAGGDFTRYPPNYTTRWIRKDGTLIHYETNRYGLREEPFRREKPENVYRILVIGDSYTFGWGLNRSDRYTDRLEDRLNRNSDREIQVINMGRTGAGIRDYYLTLRDKGLKYEPDLVLISFYRSDSISYKDILRFRDRLMEKHHLNSSGEIMQNREIRQEWSRMKDEEADYHSWNQSEFPLYFSKFHELSEEEGFEPVFFLFLRRYGKDGDLLKRDLLQRKKKCEEKVVFPPSRFQNLPSSNLTLPHDKHFNSYANRVMARHLSGYLRDNHLVPFSSR